MPTTSGHLATIVTTRQQYQADCDTVTKELMENPFTSSHMGARPKQTAVPPPTAPQPVIAQDLSNERIHVTQAGSNASHSTCASTSSRDDTQGKSKQRLNPTEDAAFIQQHLDRQSENDNLPPDTDNTVKVLVQIAQMKSRAKKCMTPAWAANISKHLQALSDEACLAQATNRDLTIHHLRLAAMTLSAVQIEVEQEEALCRSNQPSSTNNLISPIVTETDEVSAHEDITRSATESKERNLLKEFDRLF